MNRANERVLCIGEWCVNPALDEISKDGTTVKLEPRAMRVLTRLAEQPGEVVSVEQLLDDVWKDVVVTPNSVYHAIAELRRALGDDPKTPTYIANVLRRGYRLVATVTPRAEPGPDAVATGTRVPTASASPQESTVHVQVPSPGFRGRLRLAAIAAVVVLLLGAIGYALLHRSWRAATAGGIGGSANAPAEITSNPSVAVLPFVDMSDTKDQEYFADGLSEELIDRLAKIPKLHVPARTSSFYFKGKQATVAEIGKELGVAYILEGSVRKSGAMLRITAQLIRVDSGDHVWSDTFDRQLTDVFKIQDEIAGAVAQVLRVSLLPAGAAHAVATTANAEAYTLLLQARFYDYQLFNKEGEQKAVDYYEQVVRLDPASAAGWEGLSRALSELPRFGVVPWQQGRERALRAAERSLAIDPKLPAAHIALGKVRYFFDLDWPAAQSEFAAARALDPRDAYAMLWAGLLAATVGQSSDSLQMFQQALVQDPLNYYVYSRMAAADYASGRFSESAAAARKAVELSPTGAQGHALLGQALLAQGAKETALAEIERESDEGLRECAFARAYVLLGEKDKADAALRRLESDFSQNMAYGIAEVHALRGESDQAFRWLDRAYDQREMFLIFDGGVLADPHLKSLRQDGRFRTFIHKMNLAE